MEIKNLTSLLTMGVFNVFTLEDNNLLCVAHFTTKSLYFVREAVDDKYRLCIPTELSDDSTVDFIKEIYNIIQLAWKLDKKGRVSSRISDEPFYSLKIASVYKTPTGVAPVAIETLQSLFDSLKVDTTALTFNISSSTTIRDYSNLIARSEEARERIALADKVLANKPMLDKYKPIAESIRQGAFNLVYLVGPAGTGKTVLAWQFAKYCGAPMLSLQGSEGTTREDLIGYTDVKANIKTSDEPDSDNISLATPHDASQYTIVEGLLLKAYREGYHIVIDEANFMLPTVMSTINQMVDDTPTYEFKGKFIKRSPNFVLYLTSNQGYEGTNLYNPATKSRGITLDLPKLSNEEFMTRMYSNNDKLSLEFYKELYKFQDIVQEYADRWGESSSVCIRHALAFSRLITAKPLNFEEFKEQFKIAYLNNALSMDANNSGKISELLKSTEFNNVLENLYNLYDYRIIPVVEPTVSFEDAFKVFDSDWAEDTKESKDLGIDDEEFLDSFDEDDFK